MAYIFRRSIAFFTPERIEKLIRMAITTKAESLQAPEALRFLFRLDFLLYELEGKKSIEYGKGVHTKHRHTGYHEFFTSRIRPGERVLDLGCGMGEVAFEIATRCGADVVAVDLDSDKIAIAREKFYHPRIEYREGDVLEGLSEGPFDWVILSNLIEHLSDRKGFFRRLRKGPTLSKFLIRVPLFERDWRVPLKRELGVEWRLDPDHKTEYTIESFREEMADAGLAIAFEEVRWGEIWAEVVPREQA